MVPEALVFEFVPALVFRAPGFLTLVIIERLQGRRLWTGVLEKSLISLILSSLIGLLFIGLLGIRSGPGFITVLFHRPLLSLAVLLFLSGSSALLLAALLIFDPLGRLFEHLLVWSRAVVPDHRELWDRFMDQNALRPTMVTCADGTIFLGFLQGYSRDQELKAIQLSEVRRLRYDEAGDPIQTSEGSELLLLDADILRVTVLEGEPGTVEARSGESGTSTA